MLGKICIIGDGLSSLILAKALCDLNIHIDVIRRKIINKKNYQNRSLALSNSNLEFLLNLGVFKKKRDSVWKINENCTFRIILNSSFTKFRPMMLSGSHIPITTSCIN